jgi:hypothetical protein
MLPHLREIDGRLMSPQLVEEARTTYSKKKTFYNLRIKAIHRLTDNAIREGQTQKLNCLKYIHDQIYSMTKMQKEIDKAIQDSVGNDSPQYAALEVLQKDVGQLLPKKIEETTKVEKLYKIMKDRILQSCAFELRCMTLEFETAGNIQISRAKPSDPWFSASVDLLSARFFASEFSKHFPTTEMKVSKMFQVHHRFLRNRFEVFSFYFL